MGAYVTWGAVFDGCGCGGAKYRLTRARLLRADTTNTAAGAFLPPPLNDGIAAAAAASLWVVGPNGTRGHAKMVHTTTARSSECQRGSRDVCMCVRVVVCGWVRWPVFENSR
jgi:hypothetical protein